MLPNENNRQLFEYRLYKDNDTAILELLLPDANCDQVISTMTEAISLEVEMLQADKEKRAGGYTFYRIKVQDKMKILMLHDLIGMMDGFADQSTTQN